MYNYTTHNKIKIYKFLIDLNSALDQSHLKFRLITSQI